MTELKSRDEAPEASAEGAELSFDQTVPRGLAHRRALAEVLVADSTQVGEDEFLLAIQLPRGHSTWSDRRSPFHDPFVTVEAGRQGGFVLAHRYYDVPQGLAFISQHIDFDVSDLDAYRDDETSPPEAVFHLQLADKQERDGALIGVSFSGDLSVAGRVAKTMSGSMIFLPKGDYSGMRTHLRSKKPLEGAAPPPRLEPIDPALVDRFSERNVVLADVDGTPAADGEARYAVIVDQTHPCWFDHPQDHLPGPLLLEAFRQAAIATAHRTGAVSGPVAAVTECHAKFADFAEPEALVECTARVTGEPADGRIEATVGLHQFGRQIAEGQLALSVVP